MTSDDKERYVRWQSYRITQMSFTINLFISFSVASIAYAINLKFKSIPHGNIPLDITIFLWAFSAAIGVLSSISRLLDYRYTAKKIKDGGGAFNSFMSKYCGPVSWGCFWAQILLYTWGGYLFIKGALNI